MASPYGLNFLGVPDDPSGAIMAPGRGTQGASVYDLIARGYMPGDPNAFFGLLPNLVNQVPIGSVTVPPSGFYPPQDYSYVNDLIAAMGSRQSMETVNKLGEAGSTVAQQVFNPNFNFSSAPSYTDASVPIDAFGAGIDPSFTGTSWLDSVGGSLGAGYGAIAPYIPYAGALLSAGLNFAQGGEQGMLGGLGTLGGAGIGTAILPGVGTAIGATLGSLLGQLGGPSKDWITFPKRVGQTVTGTQRASQSLSDAMAAAKSPAEIYNALLDFRGDVASHIPEYGGTAGRLFNDEQRMRVAELDPSIATYQAEGMPASAVGDIGSFRGGNQALQDYVRSLSQGNLASLDSFMANPYGQLDNAIPELPGATGEEHEGGIDYNPNEVTTGLRAQLAGTLESMNATQYREPATTFASALTSARSPQELQAALDALYRGMGSNYGATAPQVSGFGQGPTDEALMSVIPDFPGLSNQDVPAALRKELLSAYTGLVDKTNPFSGRGSLPAPEGTLAGGANPRVRLGTGKTPTDTLGNALRDPSTILEEGL